MLRNANSHIIRYRIWLHLCVMTDLFILVFFLRELGGEKAMGLLLFFVLIVSVM